MNRKIRERVGSSRVLATTTFVAAGLALSAGLSACGGGGSDGGSAAGSSPAAAASTGGGGATAGAGGTTGASGSTTSGSASSAASGTGSSATAASGGTTGSSTSSLAAGTKAINGTTAEDQFASIYQLISALYGVGTGAAQATGAVKAQASVDESSGSSSASSSVSSPALSPTSSLASSPAVLDFALRQLTNATVTTSTVTTSTATDAAAGGAEAPMAVKAIDPRSKALVTLGGQCATSGTASLVLNDADNSLGLSTGDSGSFTFNQCVDGTFAYSGSMAVSGVTVDGTLTSATHAIGATLGFSALHAQDAATGSTSLTIDGGFTLTAQYQSSPHQAVAASVAGTSFRVQSGSAGAQLSNFAATVNADVTAGTYGFGASGTYAGADGTTIGLADPTPFAGAIGQLPSQGVLQIVAADGSNARLTVVSATQVRLDIDADGDGQFDETLNRSWTQLVAGD